MNEFVDWCKQAPDCKLDVDQRTKRLKVLYDAPAIRRTWWGHEPAFANNIISLANSGGLEEWVPGLDRQVVDEVERVASGLAIEHRWHDGDVLLIDNTRMMHGRTAWEHGVRNIEVRMLTVEDIPSTISEAATHRSRYRRPIQKVK